MEIFKFLFEKLFKIFIISLSVLLISSVTVSIWYGESIIWLDSTMEKISKNNQYIQIIKTKESFLKVSGKNCNTYLLKTRNSKLFEQPFELKKYTRSKFDFHKEDQEKLKKYCNIFSDINKGVPASYIAQKFKDNSTFPALLMSIIEIAHNIENKTDEIHLYVKGHADRSHTDWKATLDNDYFFEKINYYKLNHTDKSTYLISGNQISTRSIKKSNYNNNDLPFLRGKYVHEEYLKPFQNCSDKITKTGILEGEVIDIKDKNFRNTEIYVSACSANPLPGCSVK